MSDAILSVSTLGKAYSIYDSPRARLRALMSRKANGATHWALNELSFQLEKGQCLGVVGDNGAGKSTLLKLIAGTLQPTVGSVVRNGRLTAILELGAGFHPEFTGRENLYFGGALIGIEEAEMRALEASIIAFAELEAAIDRPVKTYSSGMTVRLAFALVTAVEPDILIIDEALAVGDQHFQKKCVERIESFRRNGSTILFCSHSLYHVRQLCDLTLWLDNGQARGFGPTEIVLSNYEAHVRALDQGKPETPAAKTDVPYVPRQVPRGRAGLSTVDIAGLDEAVPPMLGTKDLVITVTAYAPEGETPHIAIMLERSDGVCITAVGTHADHTTPVLQSDGSWRSTLTFPEIPLYSGEYVVSAYLFDSLGVVIYDEWRACRRFTHAFKTLEIGMVRLPHFWQ
jgi:lipopolysaccharide transport system ATP-binding protein